VHDRLRARRVVEAARDADRVARGSDERLPEVVCVLLVEVPTWDVQQHAGVSFVNGQFMSSVEIGEGNAGPVKFTNCGFWGVAGETERHVTVRGSGTVTLDACHFISWAQKEKTTPCIVAESGGLILNASEFLDNDPEKVHVELREKVQSAVIVANRFRSTAKITNKAAGDVQIGLNSSPKGGH